MNKNKVFLRAPPNILGFQELFRFIWLQGIGNKFDRHGEPKPWTDESLEDRFYELDYEIDKRTIQNWLSGKNKPSPKNLHKLARVVSNDDAGLKILWRDAFTMASVSKQKTKNLSTEPTLIQMADKSDVGSKHKIRSRALISILGFIGLLSISTVSMKSRKLPVIEVTNLKFCNKALFDRTAKLCKTNVSNFPVGTSLIFVSFNMPNATMGQPFDRKWYRDGQKFAEREGFIDSAWENYTWLENSNGHDAGKYDLRIIVNGRVTTGSFFVGTANEDHEWP